MTMKKFRPVPFLGMLFAVASVFSLMAPARANDPYANESTAQRDDRMAWWRDAKFGMFIHWGIYAVPAGFYDDKPIPGIGEWIMLNGKISVASYRAFAKDFNPTKYDPVAWASLAKDAGMRYLVITSKHHDGFALFPSAASRWNVVDATPWKKDVIAPLAEATRAQGLKFGLYYSQAQDWVHPGGAKLSGGDGEGWDDAQKGSFDSYIDQIAVPQVREILTRYEPDVLWWDTPHLMTPERAAKIAALLPLRPGIIHNNRLGGGYHGDTETPEQTIPATGIPGHDWETCMTMNDTWGFKRDDHHWKSTSELIRNLVDIVSKGGNYLLNVGPTADGEIPPESIDRLKSIGSWMKTNGESIYGTRASPFKKLPWGRCTTKIAGDDTILYLHVLDWPTDGKLVVPGLINPVKSAQLLEGGTTLVVETTDAGPVVAVPATAPDALCSTIKLVVAGPVKVADAQITEASDGVIRLLASDARLEGADVRIQGSGDDSNIGFWTNPKDVVSWQICANNDGKYLVQIEAAAPNAGSVLLIQGVGKLAYAVPNTTNFATFLTTKVGEITLTKGAKVTLTLRPVADAWQPVNVRKVELIPQP